MIEGARMKKIHNQSGMTLVELMFTIAIMGVVFSAVAGIMTRTARVIINQSRENMAETSGKLILMRIAEDVRMAYDTNVSGGAGAFWDASDQHNIFITKRENKDQYSVPNNGDNFDDVSCYQFIPPTGVYGDPGYIPGYILAGSDSGDSLCVNSDMSIISDSNIDILDLSVDYCRPSNGLPGTYSCATNVSEPGTMATSSACVWLVKLHITTRRLPTLKYAESTPLASYTTAVKPRNLYLSALATDSDKNDVVDCCDAVHVGTDVTWCPPPTKF